MVKRGMWRWGGQSVRRQAIYSNAGYIAVYSLSWCKTPLGHPATRRRIMRIALASCFVLAATAAAFVALAQTESGDQAKPRIRSLSHAIHAVEDLDTTLAFYR